MTPINLINAALLASGAVVLLIAAQRASKLLRLQRITSHARVWRVLTALMLIFFVGYLVALATILLDRADLLATVTGAVFFGGALFVLVVTHASHRTLLTLLEKSLSQKQIGQILDALGDAIMLVAEDGTIRMANRRLCELVGRPMRDVLGRPALEVVGLEVPTVTLHDSADLPYLAEHEIHGPAGVAVPVSLAVAHTEAQIGSVCALRDVSEQRLQQRRLDGAVQVAENLLRVRNEFMALVAIELHDPIRALEVLRRLATIAASPADFAAVSAKIDAACQGLERAIQGLIEVARLGGSVEGTKSFSPTLLLADVAAALVPLASRLGADISIAVEPGVLAAYFGQEAEIREVLRLLGIHALNRAPQGQIRIAAEPVPGNRTMHQLLFSVRDTGPPLTASQADLSVAPLRDTPSSTQVALDLVICRLLALALGGQLTVTNSGKQTVTAFFSVKAAPGAKEQLPSLRSFFSGVGGKEAEAAPQPQPQPQPLKDWAAPRALGEQELADIKGAVLVVEDNAATRELLVQQIRLAGHHVEAVGTIREALARIDGEQLDVVLLDVLLPDGSGVDLLAELRQRGVLERLAVLMISTLDETTSIAACLEGGAEDYLPKRVSPVVLRARMAACIEKLRLRARSRQQLALLSSESQRANQLLRVLLPGAVADELQSTGTIVPRRHENVAVIFADIVGFTAYCDRHAPEEVLASLQELFTRFESLALALGVQKIKTIGDSFMGAAGLFTDEERPALSCVALGRAMLAAIAGHPTAWQLRIGVHVGPVVAGVAGTTQFLYDIWGDTVNTAQRIESAGKAGYVCISSAARSQVERDFLIGELGSVAVKGKGLIELFAVEEARS